MTATAIHPTAVVETGCQIGEGVRIGPFCHVGPRVTLGDHCHLLSHVSVSGTTLLGASCTVHPFAALGGPPQDRTFEGEETELVIGPDTVVREQVTVHRGTAKGGGLTRIGAGCLLMVGVHVAHDCVVGNHVQLANLTTLGGHVVLGAHVTVGGHAAFAPFVRVGRGSFIAGGAMVERSVPPFVIAAGDRARVRMLNRVGLRRLGAPPATEAALARAFSKIWRCGRYDAGLRAAQEEADDPFVAELLRFLAE